MAKEKTSKEPAKTKAPPPASPASYFPLGTLRNDIDRAFDRMFKDWPRFGALTAPDFFGGGEFFGKTGAIAPRVDVTEDNNAYEITAEMPGVEPGSIEVTLERNVLTISGRAPLGEPEGKRRLYAEFEGREYRRSFELTGSADAEGIAASFHEGVLNVLAPRRVPAQRRIAVTT